MSLSCSKNREPGWAMIIHGGAGNYEVSAIENSRSFLHEIFQESRDILLRQGAGEAVLHAVKCLEDNPDYNAGTGSKIQSDGVIRMTACYMDSGRRIFSAVVNIEGVKNPIAVARLLQQEKFPSLAGVQATLYARQQGFPPYNPVTDLQLERYRQGVSGSRGTVGACAIDPHGLMAMATSTGGVGLETPGRISDDASPCGGYCSDSIAVSATGVGETIVNTICVPRLCALTDYGVSFAEACAYTEEFFQRQKGDGGWIAVSRNYEIYAFYNTRGMRHYGENHLGLILEPGM